MMRGNVSRTYRLCDDLGGMEGIMKRVIRCVGVGRASVILSPNGDIQSCKPWRRRLYHLRLFAFQSLNTVMMLGESRKRSSLQKTPTAPPSARWCKKRRCKKATTSKFSLKDPHGEWQNIATLIADSTTRCKLCINLGNCWRLRHQFVMHNANRLVLWRL